MVDKTKLVEHIQKNVMFRLTEDAETDKLMRQQAIDVFENLVDYIRNGGMIQYAGRFNNPYVKINWFTEHEQEAKTPLRIFFGQENESSADGMYTQQLQGGPAIVLYILDDESYKKDEDEIKDEIYQKIRSVYDVFVHEYIHYLDNMRAGVDLDKIATYDSNTITADQWRTYFSDPLEVNAYFQAGVSQIQSLADEPRLIDNLNRKSWEGDFRKFKDWAFDEFLPDQLLRAISSGQRKRLVNRLYGYWKSYIEPKL